MDAEALRAYLALAAADRRAIETRLPQAARAALKVQLRRLDEKAREPRLAPAPRADLSPYSPSLRKRLEYLMSDRGAQSAAPRVRETLRTLILAERRP
ncbi:MAG TPA: hypothetical protein VEA80_00795 [Vitreimonas sp.]|uniref:hypothetical protein n=1 Tax=Vitreimonas sp. TaxID=3069702 RepID=UPI002D2587B1|nr:hypothetical protein [Vitreimonas sp.]HYD85988.1 hypothetical protein [Vitreimonas sp.]